MVVKRVIDFNVSRGSRRTVRGSTSPMSDEHEHPFDEIAIEELSASRKGVATEIVAGRSDPPQAQETLRTARSPWCRPAILVQTDDEVEPLAVAKILAKIAQEEQPGMVIHRQAGDRRRQQPDPAELAALAVGRGHTSPRRSRWTGDVNVTREVDGGSRRCGSSWPALVTTTSASTSPR